MKNKLINKKKLSNIHQYSIPIQVIFYILYQHAIVSFIMAFHLVQTIPLTVAYILKEKNNKLLQNFQFLVIHT